MLDGVFSHVGKIAAISIFLDFMAKIRGAARDPQVHIVIGSRLIIILMIISLGGVADLPES